MRDVILRLRDTPGNHQNRAERRLARLLKACLRGYGWRCVDCRELPPERKEPRNECNTK